jgi:hypothetical protein
MTEYVSGNIFIRKNIMKHKGDVIQGHTHNFDHTSFVYKGGILVEATTPDGRTIKSIFRSPYHAATDLGDLNLPEGGHHFLVKANVVHKITALLDDTEFDCVYSHRTPQGEVVQVWDGWAEATL